VRNVLAILSILMAAAASANAPIAFDPISVEPERDLAHSATIEELTFDSEGYKLTGLIYIANGPGPHPTVVLLHGFPGNEKNLDIAQAARRAGFNVMFFHYRGAWGSEGNYSLLQVDRDAQRALQFLREPDNAARYRVNPKKLSVLGHSLGGYAALAAGSRDKEAICVGAISPVNLALWQTGVATKDRALQRIIDYSDTLFMLRGFNSKALRVQMDATQAEKVDTTLFGPGMQGKSVFMVVGDEDNVTPADTMFKPVVDAYSRDQKIRLQSHIISGDHSYSWSRLALTRLVLDWLQQDCR
jgi:pimeloyl-ACP methyl ester carboxylesterase